MEAMSIKKVNPPRYPKIKQHTVKLQDTKFLSSNKITWVEDVLKNADVGTQVTQDESIVFSSESIASMGPVAQGIAKILQENGRIIIKDSLKINGIYEAAIIKSELLETPHGKYLALEYTITERCQFFGKRIQERLNIENENEVVRNFSRMTLAKICRSIGITKISDTIELHNIPLKINIFEDASGFHIKDHIKIN
jgi:hypothetical protein